MVFLVWTYCFGLYVPQPAIAIHIIAGPYFIFKIAINKIRYIEIKIISIILSKER